MPRAFEITSPSSTLSLDSASKGEVTFAVTNQLDHAAKVRASIVPDGNTKAEWLSLAGAVKDINVKQTETFTVKVEVPAGTATGDHAFKIVAANDANPEEESTEGPSVKFHVGPTEKKKFPWMWLIIAAGGVLLLAGLGIGAYFLFRHKTPPVKPPPVTLGKACTDNAGCTQPAEKCAELPSGGLSCQLRPGQKCEDDRDCSSFWCLEDKKVCTRDDGHCDVDADCHFDTLICTDTKVCLKRNEQKCKESRECATGNCQGGLCKPAVAPCNPPCGKLMQCNQGKCELYRREFMLKDSNFIRLLPH